MKYTYLHTCVGYIYLSMAIWLCIRERRLICKNTLAPVLQHFIGTLKGEYTRRELIIALPPSTGTIKIKYAYRSALTRRV